MTYITVYAELLALTMRGLTLTRPSIEQTKHIITNQPLIKWLPCLKGQLPLRARETLPNSLKIALES